MKKINFQTLGNERGAINILVAMISVTMIVSMLAPLTNYSYSLLKQHYVSKQKLQSVELLEQFAKVALAAHSGAQNGVCGGTNAYHYNYISYNHQPPAQTRAEAQATYQRGLCVSKEYGSNYVKCIKAEGTSTQYCLASNTGMTIDVSDNHVLTPPPLSLPPLTPPPKDQHEYQYEQFYH